MKLNLDKSVDEAVEVGPQYDKREISNILWEIINNHPSSRQFFDVYQWFSENYFIAAHL